MADNKPEKNKSGGWVAASKTQFSKGLNGLKDADIVSQEIDIRERKPATDRKPEPTESVFHADWLKGDVTKVFTTERMARTAGQAKERAWLPVFPEPLSTHRGEGEEGKKKVGYDTELFAAQEYLVWLDRCCQFNFTGIQDVSIDYLALGTMLGYLGLERFLGVEDVEQMVSGMPKDMPIEERLRGARKKLIMKMIGKRKTVTDAIFGATIRLTRGRHENTTRESIRELLEESDYNKIFRGKIQSFERGFDYLFGLMPENLKMFVRFLTDDPDMDLMTHARLSHMGGAMEYGNEMGAFLERVRSRGPVYRQLLERPDDFIRRVHEFVVPLKYGAIPNSSLKHDDKTFVIESFLTILKLPGRLDKWEFIQEYSARDVFDKAGEEEAMRDIYLVFRPEGRYHQEEARVYFSNKFGEENISKLKFKSGVN